jgi:hypothetical protein
MTEIEELVDALIEAAMDAAPAARREADGADLYASERREIEFLAQARKALLEAVSPLPEPEPEPVMSFGTLIGARQFLVTDGPHPLHAEYRHTFFRYDEAMTAAGALEGPNAAVWSCIWEGCRWSEFELLWARGENLRAYYVVTAGDYNSGRHHLYDEAMEEVKEKALSGPAQLWRGEWGSSAPLERIWSGRAFCPFEDAP